MATRPDAAESMESEWGMPADSDSTHTSNVGFEFFNISHPLQTQSTQYRRHVRSHVAKQQHRMARASNASTTLNNIRVFRPLMASSDATGACQKSAAPQTRKAASVDNVDLKHVKSNKSASKPRAATRTSPSVLRTYSFKPQYDMKRAKSPLLQPVTPGNNKRVPSQSVSRSSSTPSRARPRKKRRETPSNNDLCLQDRNVQETTHVMNITAEATVRQEASHLNRIGVQRYDPFDCSAVAREPWCDGLLYHMLTVFAPRAWPSLQITNQQGMQWESFMTRRAMEEPALFYVRLLFASGDLVRLGVLPRGRSYLLQVQAIKAINEALSDPKRSASDGLILAVGRIALHECMYGNRDEANQIHRPAQRRMINIRGGMSKIDFPELVKRLMRWSDRVMSLQGGTERFLPDDEEHASTSYGVKQSLDAFEAWAPEPGQALRKGIVIADPVV